MRRRGLEHVDVLVLPLGGEIAPDPAAAIDGMDIAGRRVERGQPRERRAARRSRHSSAVR